MTQLAGQQGTVCRLGGDEFEVALTISEPKEAFDFAENLRRSLRESLGSREKRLPNFTASIGIACYPGDGDSAVELGRHADEAMYVAKSAGGDQTQLWQELSRARAA
jgi:diguanylate cyclase (GGDEF)-like protein